ncbi:MAG: sigma-70 family RNA polymerase sigma factor [Phycisphaerales bacterium JB039]
MERQQFEQLALEHLDAVYRMAFHLTRNAEEAEDLTQEVYLRALRPSSSENFETRGGGMRAWLFTIAHNTFYSRIKRERKAPKAVGEFFGEEAGGPAPDEAPTAWNLATLDWEHVDGRIKRAIEELRPEFREVLLLWGVEGLKYREIAEILEVPIGTVMSRLHRARKLVADQLGEQEGASEELGLGQRGVTEREAE